MNSVVPLVKRGFAYIPRNQWVKTVSLRTNKTESGFFGKEGIAWVRGGHIYIYLFVFFKGGYIYFVVNILNFSFNYMLSFRIMPCSRYF